MRKIRLYLPFVVIFMVFSCNDDDGSSGPVGPDPTVITTNEDLLSFFTGEVVGTSELIRTDNIIQMTVEAHNLTPGHIYNLSCGVYNKPENCEGVCDTEDFEDRNAEVQGVGFLVSGLEARSTTETFTATLEERDVSSFQLSPFGGDHGGLQDAQKATIEFLIRSKGPAQSGEDRQNQLTTFGGGCFYITHHIRSPNSRIPEKEGECAFIYYSRHIAPD